MFRCAGGLRALKEAPASAIYYSEQLSKALNAAWVINQTGIRFSQIHDKAPYLGMSGGELSGKKLGSLLNFMEINDPYAGIKSAFRTAKLAKYHSALNDWLKMSLTKNEFEQDYRGRRRLYRSIVKVLICCWLIYEKEILKSEPTYTQL